MARRVSAKPGTRYLIDRDRDEVITLSAEQYKLYRFACSLPADLQGDLLHVLGSTKEGRDFEAELSAFRAKLEPRRHELRA